MVLNGLFAALCAVELCVTHFLVQFNHHVIILKSVERIMQVSET